MKGMIANMNNVERVMTSLSHRQPDKTPLSIGTIIVDGISRYAKDNYERHVGRTSDLIVTSRGMQTAAMPEWFLEHISSEFRPVRMIEAFSDKTVYEEDGSFTDGFGIFWKKSEYYFDQVRGPLYDIDEITLEHINSLPWIDTKDKSKVAGMRKEALRIREAGYVVVADMMSFGTFEHALWLRGFEDFLMLFYEDPVMAEALLERTTQGGIELFDLMLSEIGDLIDIVCHGDDMGTQDNSMISPQIYDTYIKKHHKKLFDFIKTKTKAKIFMHTCGSVHSLIPGMIEAGVDILNPVQTTARNMDPETLKRDFGKDICFWGGIDTQKTLQSGTKQEIRNDIKRLVDVLGKDGGFVLAPSHNIQHTVPIENFEYMLECLDELR